jgi:hypothetical protein
MSYLVRAASLRGSLWRAISIGSSLELILSGRRSSSTRLLKRPCLKHVTGLTWLFHAEGQPAEALSQLSEKPANNLSE